LLLDSPAWLEPDLCALEDWATFSRSLVQMIATGIGQRSALVCGLSEAGRRKLERDVVAQLGGRKPAAGALIMLSRESDLSLETLPDLVRERLESTESTLGLYVVHDMGWVASRYSVDDVLAYQGRMATLRRERPFQAVHVYPPLGLEPGGQLAPDARAPSRVDGRVQQRELLLRAEAPAAPTPALPLRGGPAAQPRASPPPEPHSR